MKIVCDSCSTKYSISDDKVRGKVFKIRCKKCSHIIVVRGNGEGAPAAVEAPSDAVWHLVVDGDQVGPLAEAEVRARLSRGEISAENYVWKEGFSDWLRLVDVPEFADAGPASATASVGGDLFADSAPVPSASRPSGRHAALDEQQPFFAAGSTASAPEAVSTSSRASGRVRAPAEAVAAAVATAPEEEDAFSVPATASRANDGADLFGAAPLAARADSGRAKPRGSNGAGSGRHDGGRVENLTAQRSENSVLFSLSNLQSLAAPAATTRQPSSTSGPSTEGSGLIDIRAMAASTLKGPSFSSGPLSFGGEGSRSAADDLPTFGAFSSAAPVLFPLPSSSGPPKWIYALIVVAALLVIAVGVAAVGILRKPMIVEQAPAPAPVAVAAAPAAAPAAARALAENELPPREGKGNEGSTGDKGSDKGGGDKGASRTVAHHAVKPGAKKGGSSAGGDSKVSGESGSSDKPAAEPDKPKPTKGSLDDLLEGALNGKARARVNQDESGGGTRKGAGSGDSSGAGAGGPLAKSAVVAGMNGVKGKVAACYTQYKVPGMAMVNVVISKSGKVTTASVTGKFAGTPTGTCVESAVRSASFPPSEGLTTPYPFNLR
jgi:predicted Zn finger-like uncharacterized protein